MKRGARIVALVSLIASMAVIGVALRAESQSSAGDDPGTLLDAERAFSEARGGHHIKARELAEAIVEAHPRSFAGHFVLGFVHHYGEANFARALYHHDLARQKLERQHGRNPEDLDIRSWHFRILTDLAFTHRDLEHYDQQLRYMLLRSDLYDPDFIAERAWPLMKLRRFDDAREAARLGAESGEGRQPEIALNALCAIEFEAGDEQASYRACRAAMNLHGADPSRQGAVDFTNFAEAARSVFRLDEAERVGRLATQAQVSWYGNPWVELGELYVREGRYVEALGALQKVPEYRNRRPPHVREAGRNEGRRALSSFFLVIGRADDAIRHTEKALAAPDRRAHTSRDPQQDRAIAALLDRAARRLRAERMIESSVGAPPHERLGAWVGALSERWSAWLSGRVAARSLADEERLVGTFEIGTHRGAVMPPWLVGELADVLGAGVMREAIRRARAEDERRGSGAYYDAFAAEAALESGDPTRARELATRARSALNPAEAVLRARVIAIIAESSRRLDDSRRASEAFGEAFQIDPGVFRRLGWRVPVSYDVAGAFAADVADAISSGGRFDDEGWGLVVQVQGDRTQARACLLDAGQAVLSCADETATADGETSDEFAARLARSFFEAAFAPRVDLSQADANSLDGSNRVSRDPLQTMFGHEAPPRDE